ncbi:MAG: redoxin domain-containing protein [Bacteroidetes bacterium]|jgi:thiol-disulfide isomerase/thioredoxin|nr:redoxin domain-containing protein [Bacteroidota bacterium]
MNLRLICYVLLPFFSLGVLLQAQEPIPVFTFDELEEKLPENSEQLIIVNFWATWCKPCVKEMPYFNELSKAYENDRGVKVILVSLDMETQMQSRLIPFIEDRNLHPEVWLLDDPDANRWIDRVDPSWSGAIPATLFYKGHQRKFYQQSFHSVAELEDIIQSFK